MTVSKSKPTLKTIAKVVVIDYINTIQLTSDQSDLTTSRVKVFMFRKIKKSVFGLVLILDCKLKNCSLGS